MEDNSLILLSQREAAKRLGISANTFYKLVREEGLPIIQIGEMKRVNQQQLVDWIKSKKVVKGV